MACWQVPHARWRKSRSTSSGQLAAAMIRTHKRALALALDSLAVLSKKPKPPAVAVEVLNTLITSQAQEQSVTEFKHPFSSEAYQSGLAALKQLGCVEI